MPAIFQGTSFLLTYPQTTFDDYRRFLDFLGQLGSIKYLLVAREQHQSGDSHQHAVVLFDTKRRLGERAFDFEGRHPNIRPVGRKIEDWNRCVEYCRKEDVAPFEYGTPRHSSESVWAIVAEAPTREEALAIVKKERPRDYVLNRRNLDYSLDQVCLAHFHK